MPDAASSSELFPDPPPDPDDAAAWGQWAVEFFDQFCGIWTCWRLTWGWREKRSYRRGDPYAPWSVEREDRVIRTWHAFETGDPPRRLRDAPRLLDALSGAVQAFSEQSMWTFESTKQADEVAQALLKVAQSIRSEDYRTVADAKPEELGPLLKTAIRRRRSISGLAEPALQSSAAEGHGAGTAAHQTPPEPLIRKRALKAGEQYRQAAEALGVSDPADREAYDQLATAMASSGEKMDLPRFDTWQRNLREYRRLTGQQKNKPRAGREGSAGSLVRADQIEPEQLPTCIRPKSFDK